MDRLIYRGDVYTVDLGDGRGSEQRGHKYCMVVQNNEGNKHAPTVTIVPITSKNNGFNLTHVEIKEVLRETSYILCEQIRTVDKSRLKSMVAQVTNKKTLDEVADKIKIQLGI